MGNSYGTTRVIWMNERLDYRVKINKDMQVFFKNIFRQDNLPYKIHIRGIYDAKNKSDYVIIIKFKSKFASIDFKKNIVLRDSFPKGTTSNAFHQIVSMIKHNPHKRTWTKNMLNVSYD